MQTIITIALLAIFTLLANGISTIALNIGGLPGALLAKNSNKEDSLFYIGAVISSLGQSFIYLAYVASIINFGNFSIEDGQSPFLIWIAVFATSLVPIVLNVSNAKREAFEYGYITNPQIAGLKITQVIALIAFFFFAFNEGFMYSIYGWIL